MQPGGPARTVWGYGYFGDSRIVDVHIRRLRTKIERDPANPSHVVTARGLATGSCPDVMTGAEGVLRRGRSGSGAG